jgi:hypothetical protein
MKTYYDLLHVAEGADPAVIEASFRSLNKQHYEQGTQESTEFADILKAFERLSNPERRAKYDEKLKIMPTAGASASSASVKPVQKSFYERNKVGVWVGLAVSAVIIVCAIGNSQTYTWTKVDVAEHKETFHEETKNTGSYDVHDTGSPICTSGDDYLSCVNSHVTMYNEVCAKKSLTSSAKDICDALDKYIDDIKASYRNCGYGCKTGGSGKWGWNYLTSEAETKTEKVSNNDYTPAKTHEATCIWGLWGECL